MKWLFVISMLIVVSLVGWFLAVAYGRKSLRPGQAAPDFKLIDQHGKTYSLEDFKGKWLALYFYPKDDTPGCTRQACAFRDNLEKLKALDVEVVGVSVDTVGSHERFADKFGLRFPLLADTNAEMTACYSSLLNLGVVKFAKRNTFLIDPFGKIARIYWSARAAHNADEIISDLVHLKHKSHA
ncbi:peroxiredoxin [Nitrosomonas sp.]|uniref:peroxiredoxin n=1 Tax=Nitrosomonas sp. TaxID=42353 RepID=UPI001DBAF61D|nr:peroxiredoxin [Nitrosomonas sp.]MCB1948221.1 peroxiredoxin [Nitrosomonas sp.]MDR4513778.1 peroxiredoxin [Nitrosomonas sp.]